MENVINRTTCAHRVAILYALRSLPSKSPGTLPASLSLVLACWHLHPSPPTLCLVCLSSLFSLHGQSHMLALVPELPNPTASLLPVSLACQCLLPGPPLLPLPRMLLPSSPLLCPCPARMSPVAPQANERVPRTRALSLAWSTCPRPCVHKSQPIAFYF